MLFLQASCAIACAVFLGLSLLEGEFLFHCLVRSVFRYAHVTLKLSSLYLSIRFSR